MSGYRSSSFKLGLAGSAAALALAPVLGATPAFAQIAPATPVPTAASVPSGQTGPASENVVVTGSRLRTSNLNSEAPVTVISAKQIQQSSSQTVEDVLRKIPSIGTDGLTSTVNNGGNGASCLDLRNLGVNRTLVLVDGRRFIRSPYGNGNDCVDLDTIPVALIDRIEILKDGASSIYGADAVAGVINIVMKKNFVGSQINIGGDITASGDNKQGDISGTTGFDFANGRGNVALSARYLDRGPVNQKDRDWSNPAVTGDNGPGEPYTYGSGFVSAGRYFAQNPDGSSTSLGTLKNGAFAPFTSADRYNLASAAQLSDRETQGNFGGSAHYDFNDHIQAYVSGYYTHKDTTTQLNGQPLTSAANPNTNQPFVIPAGNPYAEALGINQTLTETRRFDDWGPRDYHTGVDTWQVTAGVKGNITGNWDYDAYYTYGHSATTLQYTNQINTVNLEREVGLQASNPLDLVGTGVYNSSVCTSQPGCVLANPFGTGSFSQSAINYASFTSSARAITQLRDLGATITNNKLIQLPYGPLGLAIGMEHRGEQGAYHPDPTIQSGAAAASFEDPTGGGYNVTEVFGELSIPLLKNLIMAKDLSADVSGRYSDYSTFGSVETWKAGLNWSPTRDIRFRANIGTATRQPAISEAFGGDVGSFNTATDPCAQAGSYGAAAGIVAANCARRGVNTATFQQTSNQILTLVGGNPNLLPETSRTYTIGTVLTPRWVKNFSATIDYWHTSINNAIGSISTQYVLDQCYTSANLSSPLCAQAGTRGANGQVNTVQALESNLGVIRTNGIDFDMNYLVKLGGGHTLSFSNELVDLIGYTAQSVNDGPFINLKGRVSLFNTAGYPIGYPVIRDNFTTTYAKGPFSFSWTMRYIDGMTFNDGSTDATPATNRYYRSNEVFYHDIVATYNFKKLQLIAGIDNLFDKDPPFVLDGATNTAATVYDVFGRLFYAKLQYRF